MCHPLHHPAVVDHRDRSWWPGVSPAAPPGRRGPPRSFLVARCVTRCTTRPRIVVAMISQAIGDGHHASVEMASIERRGDRGRCRADRSIRAIGEEVRTIRLNSGISLREAGRAVGLSYSTFGRIERGDLRNVSVRELSVACSAVGLDLVLRAYSDGDPVRDAAHGLLLERIHRELPSSAPWRTEVPLPIKGDRRAWDAMTVLERARIAFEAETRLADIQALSRKLELKRRDGRVDIVVLVVADTHHNRSVLAIHRDSLRAAFPLDSRAVLAALRTGRAPRASGLVVI